MGKSSRRSMDARAVDTSDCGSCGLACFTRFWICLDYWLSAFCTRFWWQSWECTSPVYGTNSRAREAAISSRWSRKYYRLFHLPFCKFFYDRLFKLCTCLWAFGISSSFVFQLNITIWYWTALSWVGAQSGSIIQQCRGTSLRIFLESLRRNW